MKSLLFALAILVASTSALFSQSTTIKLPTADETSSFVVTDNSNTVLSKLYGNGEFYMLGNYSGTALPALGPGPHLSWDPYDAAFRAGYVAGTQWDAANIGLQSFATGLNTTANALSSTAMGSGTTASGENSTAMGSSTTASGFASTAMGQSTTASGSNSTAMGQSTTASGNNGTAIGSYVSTNSEGGSCIIGDNSTVGSTTSSTAINQMMMRFNGGYIFYTSSVASSSAACYLNNGQNAWTTTSDSTKKELFTKANGEYFLQSISELRLGSWNYKSQDAMHYRHYGHMAQEIFHYFGKDTYGTIGNDTSLATADMDGIEMICLQALEKRTSELQKTAAKVAELEKTVSEQKDELAYRDKDIEELKSDFIQLKKEIAAMELKQSPDHASLTSADTPK